MCIVNISVLIALGANDLSMFSSLKRWLGSFLVAVLLLPLLSVGQAQAVTVSLLSSSTLSNGMAVINIGAPANTKCEVAVGSVQGSPDYKWFSSAPCTQFVVTNLSTVSQVHVRVFAGGPAQDFVLRTSGVVNPVPIQNSPQSPAPAPVIGTPAYPYITSPASKAIVVGPSADIRWTDVKAEKYTVTVGSYTGGSNYGTYTAMSPSLTITNLPQNNKNIFVRVKGHWGKQVRWHERLLISAPTPPTPEVPPAVPPVVIPPVIPSVPVTGAGSISAVWANEGGDKVAQEELRAGSGVNVNNSVWNGNTVAVFGAKNEVVNFNLVLEAAQKNTGPISVSFDQLTGPNGFTIKGKSATGANLYDWNGRNIELFFVRYLEIKGLSAFMAGNYDEQQLPARWRAANRQWTSRPAHNLSFPDIAVPSELHDNFTIAAGKNQSIWADVYIPKTAPAGVYTGNVTIKENGTITRIIPVQLTVRNFALPDEPTSKTMLFLGYKDINQRYFGVDYPAGTDANVAAIKSLRDKHFMLAHRHKISLIDADPNESVWQNDAPRPDWVPRLNGQLFTAANGYDGPGVGVGNGVYAIAPYGQWGWKNEGQAGMWKHTDNWANWFAANAPAAEYFLHLIDEPREEVFPQIEQWAQWINSNPGPGKNVPSMVTMWPMDARKNTPSLDYVVAGMTLGQTDIWQTAVNYYQNTPGKKFMMYNGGRPGNGSFMMDDDGVALRELAWAQYKKKVERWFYWESTYYLSFQGNDYTKANETNVFKKAQTFGANGHFNDAIRGQQSDFNYSNGDGVMFYPGTDKIYPTESYNLPGPIASLRLKYWRRGIQDVDYVALANKINPTKTQQIINQMVPKVLWEVGVENLSDPTYLNGPVSWSDDPNVWEIARVQLADIIEGK